MTATANRVTPVSVAVAGALTMMAHQVGAKSVRDSLFLTSFDITELPIMVVVASLFSLVLVFPASWATTKFTPGRLVPWMFITSGVFYGTVWLVGSLQPKAAAVAVFLAVVGFGSLITSGFWALISERLDPYSLRKAVGKIGAGGSVGVALGGLLTERIGATFDAMAMLLVLAVLHFGCGLFAFALRSSAPPPSADLETRASQPPRSILNLAREAPHLRILAALVLVGTVGAGMIDYVFKAQSATAFTDKETLLRFFAIFYAATGGITFVIQTLISRTALERFGLAKTVGTMPLSVVAGGLGALLFPGLTSTALARGSESIFRGSLFRSGYELFYAPIPAEEKRAAKPILDVGFDRLGEAAAGGAVKLILFLSPAMAMNVILALAVALGLLGFWIALQLQQAYLQILERNLVGQRKSLQDRGQSEGSILTSVLLPHTVYAESPDRGHSSAVEGSQGPRSELDQSAAIAGDLCSGETERIAAGLARCHRPPPYVVAHVIPLLGSPALYGDVLGVLRTSAKKYTGQLVDALISPETSETVRQRLPRALSSCRTQRCLDGLTLGLNDESFDVRQSCGRALAALHRAAPELRVDKELVLAAAKREAVLSRTVWEAFRDNREEQLGRDGSLAQALLENASSKVVKHIFTILTLVIRWEPLQMAYYSLRTDDTHLRGTALEYLDGVLPADVREELWPYLEDGQVKGRPRMSFEAALEELIRTRSLIGDEIERSTRELTGEEPGIE